MPIGAELVDTKKKKRKQSAKEEDIIGDPKEQNLRQIQSKKQGTQSQRGKKQHPKLVHEELATEPTKKPIFPDIPVPNYDHSFKSDSSVGGDLEFRISKWFEAGRDCRAFPARGVTNPANLCYAASVMQSLIHCAPIAHFCATVASPSVSKGTKQEVAPVAAMLGGWMIHYWRGMRAGNIGGSGSQNRVTTTPMASPKLGNLNALKVEGSAVDGHRQQDAHELVVALLQSLQQEAAALQWDGGKMIESGADAVEEATQEDGEKKGNHGKEKAWTVVGRGKNVKLTVRTHTERGGDADGTISSATEGPGGFFRRLITGTMSQHFKGSKGTKKGHTSVVVEPFLSVLTLDIGLKPKQTLEEALSYLSVKEVIENSSQDGSGSDIKKVTFLASAPDVLVIMLQRYLWTREGERVKLDNLVEFGSTLVLPGDVVDPTLGVALGKASSRTFGLQSVVCHRGNTPNSGHYVTYTPDTPVTKLPIGGGKQRRDGTFTVFNDSRVGSATWKEVLADTPYLLWYQRLS